ncbi:hypothetical protein HMY34_19555 [Thiothrix subterranea]|uniref:hypothetical protein n=1 Tax=Thiothrix subterranea TaxID=2735563 RepID=UPI00192C420A|nr:hypothetical protein [Thiothrix subterranea]QQZ30773.1 hypothetical protein HMY34_19555 [Thiothrix subterranea]
MNKWWGFLISLWLLSGCAPQYETRYEFTPPTSTGGLSCLNRCETQTRTCNLQCNLQYGQCSAKAEQQAKAELPAKLSEYDTRLAAWQRERERYETDLRFYEMELRQRELQHDLRRLTCDRDGKESASCLHHHSLLNGMSSLNEPRRPDNMPEKPTLTSETVRIRELICSSECQCDTQYRQCYTSCGGAVKPYQFCVENCPK